MLASEKNDETVVCVNGQFTAFLRARWGLIKQREQGDKHHALDAAVIASATRSLIKRVSDFSRYGKLIQRPDGLFVSRDTGEILDSKTVATIGTRFPQPWDHFRDELIARLDEQPIEKLGALGLSSYNQANNGNIRSVFVSRAPKRRNRGAAHQETIRSAQKLAEGVSVIRTPLQKLSLKSLEDLVAADDPRNKPLYEAIRQRLQAANNDAKKAFAEPLFKPDMAGNPTTVVRTVKLKVTQKGGVLVRNGIADQATMIRVDMFKKGGKFFAIPIYQSDRVEQALPTKAVVGGKPHVEWTEVDDSYEFLFSLYPNDVVRLVKKDEDFFGYFAGLDVATGAIHIMVHDRNKDRAKDGVYRSLGVRNADCLEKFHVDALGHTFKVKQEQRNALA